MQVHSEFLRLLSQMNEEQAVAMGKMIGDAMESANYNMDAPSVLKARQDNNVDELVMFDGTLGELFDVVFSNENIFKLWTKNIHGKSQSDRMTEEKLI